MICKSLRNGVVVAAAGAAVLGRKPGSALPPVPALCPEEGRKSEPMDVGLLPSMALLVERKGEEGASPLFSFFSSAAGRNVGCCPRRDDRGDVVPVAGFCAPKVDV